MLQGINGNKMEKACDLVHITLNKNAVVGDVSALAPGGVRIGAPAMTSRGLREADFEKIADLLHEVRCNVACRLYSSEKAHEDLRVAAFRSRRPLVVCAALSVVCTSFGCLGGCANACAWSVRKDLLAAGAGPGQGCAGQVWQAVQGVAQVGPLPFLGQ